MADRRMFSKVVVESDMFLDMPITARALYFHLGMQADDFGFINSPKKVQRMVGCSDDDMKLLIAKGFLIPFDSGVVLVRHWKQNNYIRPDRCKPTVCQSEADMISVGKAGQYELCQPVVNQLTTICQPNDIPSDNQLTVNCHPSIDKYSLVQSSIGDKASADASAKPTRHKYGRYENVLLSDEDMVKLKQEFPTDWEERIERLSEYIASKGAKYKNHLATIRVWARKDKNEEKPKDDEPPKTKWFFAGGD